ETAGYRSGDGGQAMSTSNESDGSRCFAHGLEHLVRDLGYEEGLALAGWAVLNLLESQGRSESDGEPDSGGHEGGNRRLNAYRSGTYWSPAWGVRPAVITSSLDALAGPISHKSTVGGRRRHSRQRGETMGQQTATVEVD